MRSLPSFTRAFIDNEAAQAIYFFKSMYFIVSALQMISGYPERLLKNFAAKNFSTPVGIIFLGLVPSIIIIIIGMIFFMYQISCNTHHPRVKGSDGLGVY